MSMADTQHEQLQGGEPQGQAPADGAGTSEEKPGTGQQQVPAEAKLTQSEVDEIVKRRLAAERKKWQTEAEEAAKKASMSETERLRSEKEAAERAAAEARAQAQATLVRAEAKVQALAAGAPLATIDDVLKLVDLGAVEVDDEGAFDAKAIVAAIADVKKRLPGLFAVAQGAAQAKGPADFSASNGGKRRYSAAEVSALIRSDPKKWGEIREDYLAAMQEGRVDG